MFGLEAKLVVCCVQQWWDVGQNIMFKQLGDGSCKGNRSIVPSITYVFILVFANGQSRINNSSKCSNFYVPHTFGVPAVFRVKFFFIICKGGFKCRRKIFKKEAHVLHMLYFTHAIPKFNFLKAESKLNFSFCLGICFCVKVPFALQIVWSDLILYCQLYKLFQLFTHARMKKCGSYERYLSIRRICVKKLWRTLQFHEFVKNISTFYTCYNHKMWIIWKSIVRKIFFFG